MEKILMCLVMFLFLGAKPIEKQNVQIQWRHSLDKRTDAIISLKEDLIKLDSLCGKISE